MGFSTRYDPPDSTGHFALVTAPEVSLGLPGPVIELDERGVPTKRATPDQPAYAMLSPVPYMLAVRQCVDSAISLGRFTVLHEALVDTAGPCASVGLRPHSFGSADSVRNARRAAALLTLPAKAIGWSIALRYILEYVAPDSSAPGTFDVQARPRSYPGPGLRSFLLTAAGTLHATAENRPATPSDPAPFECEVDPRVPCWR